MSDSFLRTRAWFGSSFLQCPYGGKVSQGSFLRTVMVSGSHSSAYIHPPRASRGPRIPTVMLPLLHSSAYNYPFRVSRSPLCKATNLGLEPRTWRFGDARSRARGVAEHSAPHEQGVRKKDSTEFLRFSFQKRFCRGVLDGCSLWSARSLCTTSSRPSATTTPLSCLGRTKRACRKPPSASR